MPRAAEIPVKPLHCPRPACKSENVGTLKFQGETYMQCKACKFWSTKFTPENPGSFAE